MHFNGAERSTGTEMAHNVVSNPILNSPFAEPERHWVFGAGAPRVEPGRRLAGYHQNAGDRAGGEHPFVSLAQVNEIRARVKAWRERGWPGVTSTTRDLLEHWSRPERRQLFFCQREAVETIIWLMEASPADRQGIEVPPDEPSPKDREEHAFTALRRWCAKMATGSGKTIVMAMVSAWSILNKVANKQDARFSDGVLLVAPNLTVRERLAVLVPQTPGNYYEQFDIVPPGYAPLLGRGRVGILNWHLFALKDDGRRRGIVQRGKESDAALVRRVMDDAGLGGATQILVLNDEAHHAYRHAWDVAPEAEQLRLDGLTPDERDEIAEREREATVWVGGLDRIHKVRGIRLVVDLSATPFYLTGSGHEEGSPIPWIVSDFGLVDAIESGITKVPRIPIADDSGRPDPKYFRLWRAINDALPANEREGMRRRAKPESVWREAQGAMTTLATKWKATFEHFEASRFPVPPTMIVVAANTALAKVVTQGIQRGEALDALSAHTYQIDSSVLDAAEGDDGATKDEAKELLRLKTSTVGRATWPDGRPPPGHEDLAVPPGKDVRCVVSVGMLTEGWDAPNVTQILGLRAFGSQLLCEQVVGRGLRRMSYEIGDDGLLTPEYCDVFGVPFELVPIQGDGPSMPPKELPPSTLVQALDERKQLAIEFPRVIGYLRDIKARVKCDVDALPPLFPEPQVDPTQTTVAPQIGAGNKLVHASEDLNRYSWHEEHRLQRTLFEIARNVIDGLAGEAMPEETPEQTAERRRKASFLFPQVLEIARAYVERRVFPASGVPREEVGQLRYRDEIVSRLLASIVTDVDAGEAAVLPRIERGRPTGSTHGVMFRTTKPTKLTSKSHVSHVTLDSPEWEGTAAWQLEHAARVTSYVKNDRLGFEIPYIWQDKDHRYEPDFLARVDLDDGSTATLIVEIKGMEREQDRAKQTAAAQWVRAVNNHGGFGVWGYIVCRRPNELGAMVHAWKP